MGKWTVEKLTDELKAILGERLVSVVLYGSAAAGDHTGKKSDTNILVVTHPVKRAELLSLSKAVVPWVKKGNPAPLFLTQEHLKDFVDVFPIEILDMQSNHQVLYGEDPLSVLSVSNDHLRVELEHELQGKLLQLKTRYILTEGKSDKVWRLMIESISTFLVLFKNALWFYDEKPPLKKMDALRKLRERFDFETEAFERIDAVKRGAKPKGSDAVVIFEEYLDAIETVIDRINL
jgi:hypothetical protein